MYKIEKYTITLESGEIKEKYKIIYIGGEFDKLEEYYAKDLSNPEGIIRQGYTKHPDSL